MSFQVGDRVLVDANALGAHDVNGRIFRVTCVKGNGLYTLSDGTDFDFAEQFLVPVELPIKVSVGWDLTKDLSITTEVLRMLLAAAMECFLEESPQC